MDITKTQTETFRAPEIGEPISLMEKDLENVDSQLLAGLMLALQLRESLSQRDRSLLNKLAPTDRSVFVVADDNFVHPEGFDTFPLDHISGCVGDQAFFSHRFYPEDGQSSQACIIQTAVINPGDPNPFLFGWFGPESTSPDGGWDHRFSQLVADLRRAWSESAALTQRMQAQLNRSVPTLVVDHLAGRLLWLNKSAAELCGQDRSELVDLGFEQVRTMLSRNLTGRRLTMKRFSTQDIEVTLVTLPEIRTTPHPINRITTDSLVLPSQQKLAGIIMAAELLRSSLSDKGDSEGAELSDIIACDARELDDLLSEQMLPGDLIDDSFNSTGPTKNPHTILETR